MDRKEAENYVATCLAMRTLDNLRMSYAHARYVHEKESAEIGAKLTSEAAKALGMGEEYEEILAHLLKCNPVKGRS